MRNMHIVPEFFAPILPMTYYRIPNLPIMRHTYNAPHVYMRCF